MRKNLAISTLAVVAMASQGLFAQDEEKAPEQYIYATYFYCDTARQEEVDELVK